MQRASRTTQIDMPSPIIYYIRHGETAWNAEGRFQGSRDIPLNERGRTQAAAAGEILRDLIARDAREPHHFGYVSSPLSRARTTMDLLRGSLGLPADGYAVEHRLREIGWGDWEGLTVPEMQAHDPVTFAARRKDRWNVTAPKGETYAEVATRMRAWLAGADVRHGCGRAWRHHARADGCDRRCDARSKPSRRRSSRASSTCSRAAR